MEGGRQKGVVGMVEGASRQAEEEDWRADGCRSLAELTGGRAGNLLFRVAVKIHVTSFECYSLFVLTTLVVLFNWRTGRGSATHGK